MCIRDRVMDVSTDSAYRRIRGEKPISLEEIYKICVRYGLSLDNLLNLKSDAFMFKGNFVNPHAFKYDDYLSNVMQQICLLYTSDAADERSSVDLGGRRII